MAERFELYIGGVEIANGYHELLDPAELRARNAKVNAQRRADGKPPLPEESRLLAAMESGLPPSVGVALGFDRLRDGRPRRKNHRRGNSVSFRSSVEW